MRPIKQLLSLLIITMMAFFITGCGGGSADSGDGSQISPILVGIKVVGIDNSL